MAVENARPMFLAGGLEVLGQPRRMGGGERHLSFRVSQNGIDAAGRRLRHGRALRRADVRRRPLLPRLHAEDQRVAGLPQRGAGGGRLPGRGRGRG